MIHVISGYIYTVVNYTLFNFLGVNFSIASFTILILNFTIVWLITKLVQLFIRKFLLVKLDVDIGTREAVTTLITYFVGVVGTLIALKSIGLHLSSLIVVAGGLGLGLGFSLQNIARDLLSGIIILIRRTIKVNDFLQFGSNHEFRNLQGTVTNIELLSTLIKTKDGATLILPNSQLFISPILNWSFGSSYNRIIIPIYIRPDSDIVLFTETVLSTVSQEHAIVSDPAPCLIFKKLGQKYLEFELYVWTKTFKDEAFIRSSVNFAVEYNLRQRGIYISFPDQNIYFQALSTPAATIPEKVTLHQHISIRDLLKKVPYFADFTELELRKLIEIGYRQRLVLGQVLFNEGDVGDAFYIVLEGSVEIFTPKINKQLNVFTEGTFFGELSLILGIPRTASVKALETTILFVIHHQQFEKLIHEYPELAQVIIQELPKYQQELVERRKQLQEMNLLDDDTDDNWAVWVRKRLEKIFSLSI